MGRKTGQDSLYGHYHGVESVRNVVEACAELGIGYLTSIRFFNGKLGRPAGRSEWVDGIAGRTIRKEVDTLNKNNIRLHVIGDIDNASREYKK